MNLLENEHPAWTGGMADGRTDRPADRRVDLMGSPTGLVAPDQSSEDRIDTTWLGEDPVSVRSGTQIQMRRYSRRIGDEDAFEVANTNQPHREVQEAIAPLSRPTNRMSRKKCNRSPFGHLMRRFGGRTAPTARPDYNI
jgi:hypothetical protein